MSQNLPVYDLPTLAISGLEISNDSTNPDEIINIAAGRARDVDNNIDLGVGADYPNLQNVTVTAPLTVNNTLSGVGGLDTGTVAANTIYAVYLVGDSRYYKPVVGMLSLASNSQPRMPFEYDSYRKIGYAITDATSDFLLMNTAGSGHERILMFDAPQATSVTAGNSTTYAGVDLSALVPPVQNTIVSIQSVFNANAAADILNMQGFDSTGDSVSIIAPVAGATARTWALNDVFAQLDTAAPKIKYKVSAGAVAINVAGFKYFV